MARELKEEIGYEIQNSKLEYLGKVLIVQNEGIHNIHHVFSYEMKNAISCRLSKEHTDFQWFSKKEASSIALIPYQNEVLSKFKIYDGD